jgi:hypothetical protein
MLVLDLGTTKSLGLRNQSLIMGDYRKKPLAIPKEQDGPPRSKPVSISYLLASGTAYQHRKTRS